MTDFREQLETKWESKDGRDRMWRGIQCGDFWVSIQASETAYSCPREVLRSPYDYVAFEVGIFDMKGNWKTKDVASALGMSTPDDVLGYVPTRDVQRIVDWCSKGYTDD